MELDLKEITSKIKTFTLTLYFLEICHCYPEDSWKSNKFRFFKDKLGVIPRYCILDLIPLDFFPI